MTLSADVAVLGAGPAGLGAALFAARRGLDVVLVERAAVVGGLAASFEIAGERVDHGSHRLHPSIDPELLATLQALLGDELQTRPRSGRIRLRNRWLGFPLRPTDLVRHAPPGLALGAARDLALAPWRQRRTDSSGTFAARALAGLGPTITTAFYEPYARKLFGVDPTELSGELYRRRVSAGSSIGLVRRVLRGARPSSRTFLYPAGGFGRIAEVLADAFVDAGGAMLLGNGAGAIDLCADRAAVTLAGGERIEARTVVSTLPGRVTLELLGDTVPTDARDAAHALEHRGAVLVYLVVDRPTYTAFDAHYFPEAGNPVARLSEPKNYRSSAADPESTTVLCAELPATEGDATWTSDDGALGELVSGALDRAGLPAPLAIGVAVRRVPFVYPVYRVGFEGAQQAVEAWAAQQPALLLVGRQALFAHDNTHHALAMGRAAGLSLDDRGRLDERAWELARDGFREHVVED